MDPILGMTILFVFAAVMIGIIFYLLQQQKAKHHAMLGQPQVHEQNQQHISQPKSHQTKQSIQAAPQEPIVQSEKQGVTHFHKVERTMERARDKIFGSFTSADAMNNAKNKGKQAAVQSHNYKMRHVNKIVAKTDEENQQEHIAHHENLSTIKGISKAAPVSRMRKLFKKPDNKYLQKIIKQEEEEELKGEDSNSMKKLAGISSEKSKAVTRLKFLRRSKK